MYGIVISMTSEMISSAGRFKALGDPTRLRIMRMLACCPDRIDEAESGPTAGQVCCQVTGADQINSTVSHHLKELREAGLIQMERSGKTMVCSLEREALRRLAEELILLADGGPDDCC